MKLKVKIQRKLPIPPKLMKEKQADQALHQKICPKTTYRRTARIIEALQIEIRRHQISLGNNHLQIILKIVLTRIQKYRMLIAAHQAP